MQKICVFIYKIIILIVMTDIILVGVIILLLIVLFYMKKQNYQMLRWRYQISPVRSLKPAEIPHLRTSQPNELAKCIGNASKTQAEGDNDVAWPKKPSPAGSKQLELSKMTARWKVLKSDPVTDDTGRIQIKTTTDMETPLSFALSKRCECTCSTGVPVSRKLEFES